VVSYEALIDEAERAPIDGWDFSWLEGRATEDRPSWRYSEQVAEGPGSVRELSEIMMGPRPRGSDRDPELARRAAENAGLEVTDLQSQRLRTVFYDVGAVVYFLRLVIWIVPGFTVAAYDEQLRALHAQIQHDGSFVAHATRFLIEATKPA
jgi:hypothetical protein